MVAAPRLPFRPMRTRLVGVIAALAMALGALAFPSAEPVQAASTCTGWTSTLVPPTSIRVYRTALKRTETVAFRTYVEKVMAAEWGATTPRQALEAGAVAVKQFGWYYARYWRGGKDAAGRCYDVSDSSSDQVYSPSRTVAASHRAAVAATWKVSLWKGDRFFLTGYRPGTGVCTANIDGWRLYQRDAVDCVRDYRDSAESLARRFYSLVSWVSPGANDTSGDGRGDLIVLSADSATGDATVTVQTSDTKYRTAVAGGSLVGAVVSSNPGDRLLARAAGDVTGDGRSDLVELVRIEGGVALEVIESTATGFAPAVRWWRSTDDPASIGDGTFSLVVADFTNDGIGDAGVVRARGGDAPTAGLYMAAASNGRFLSVKRAWSVSADLSAATFLAGDVTGDGRADLVVLSAAETGGTTIRVARSRGILPHSALAVWGTITSPPDAIKALVADANRDGRDDLVVVRRVGEDNLQAAVYRASSSATSFSRLFFTGTLELSFAGSRFAAADWSGDGRADLYALVDRGTDGDGNPRGADVWRFQSTGTTYSPAKWLTLDGLAWETALPY